MDQYKKYLEERIDSLNNEAKKLKSDEDSSYLNSKIITLTDCLITYDKFHPSTIKLSEIVKKLKPLFPLGISINVFSKVKKIRIDMESGSYNYSEIVIIDNKIIKIDLEWIDDLNWLFQYANDGTEIINDLEGENG